MPIRRLVHAVLHILLGYKNCPKFYRIQLEAPTSPIWCQDCKQLTTCNVRLFDWVSKA